MKNKFCKVITICFSLFLVLFSLLPVSAEPDDETRTIRSSFYVLTTQQNRSIDVKFNRNWFMQDAREYSHDLAKLSLGLATSAFRPKNSQSKADSNLSSFLIQAGFGGLRSDDYDKDPNMYTISTVMGHQKIGSGDDAFELIAVGLCGQGYLDEWESNFSIGDGDEHDGFSRSSQLVYDRIFGYIASEHLSGRLKIWLSGFSRAAAVTNITAARLSDSALFDEHTVFAYTFATPRTTRRSDPWKYRNIFNIVGKADPVPNVPFADWGFERYGTTLYTPCVQTDSDYTEKRAAADVIYKELTGIDYWVNPEADAMSRIILAYLQKICPTAKIYAQSLQKKLILLWEDRSPLNILSNLLEIANDPVLINEETRTEANGLMDYLAQVFQDYLNSTNSFHRWNSRASLGANALQAHTPELYISWVYSVDRGEDLYTDADTYHMIYTQHAGSLSLLRDGKVIEEIKAEEDEETPHLYLERSDDYLTAMIPLDGEYSLRLEPEGEGMIDMFELEYKVGHQSNDHTYMLSFEIPANDTLTITYTKDGNTYYSKEGTLDNQQVFKEELHFTQSGVTSLLRKAMSESSWRDIVMFFLWIPVFFAALIIFQITYVIGRIRFNHRVKLGWIKKGTKYHAFPFLLVTEIFMLFFLMMISSVLFDNSYEVMISYKKAIDGTAVLLALIGILIRRDWFTAFTAAGTMLLAAADLTTTGSLQIGAILHILAYLVLSFIYIRRDRPGKRQIIMFIIMSAISIYNVMSIEGNYGILRVLAILYLVSACLMVVSSFTLPRRLFVGSLFLFAAGILLISNQINGETFFSHTISLGAFYTALALIASSGTQTRMPRLVPETTVSEKGTPE